MKINGEEVKPVTSLDELQPGRLAWVSPCTSCGSKHRGMIGNVLRPYANRIALEWHPPPACLPASRFGLLEGTPDNVFLVVDGLPDRATDAMVALSDDMAARGIARLRRLRVE